MSSIQGNITIDLPDGVSPNEITGIVHRIIQQFTGSTTKINVIEVDNPLSLSPIQFKKIGDHGDE